MFSCICFKTWQSIYNWAVQLVKRISFCSNFWPRAYYAKAVLQLEMLLVLFRQFDTFVWIDRFETNGPFCLNIEGNGGLRYSCWPGGLAALSALLPPWRPCCPVDLAALLDLLPWRPCCPGGLAAVVSCCILKHLKTFLESMLPWWYPAAY